jgi:diguanylate cyclase (GGDEF)-like protein
LNTPPFLSAWEPRIAGIHRILERSLFILSTYAIGVFILCASVVALTEWKPQYGENILIPVPVRVIESDEDMSLTDAVRHLEEARPTLFRDTRLSETPFWFSFDAAPGTDSMPPVLEFPSRHATEIACWRASGAFLGKADRNNATGAMTAAKAGFALRLNAATSTEKVVCRASFIGPARLSVLRWPVSELQLSANAFYRDAGLLEGGLLTLTCFMVITALVNRRAKYVLFSVWLILGLRTAALSAGWDTQWLGRAIPQEYLPRVRLMTLTCYYMVTVCLFQTQFRDDLARLGSLKSLRLLQWSCLPLVALSAVSEPGHILKPFWVCTAVFIVILLYLLGHLLVRTRSRVAVWYSASLLIWLFAALSEIIGAAMGFRNLAGAVNSVTAALASVLLAALAVAEQMRLDHIDRLEARAELQHNYEAIPIGLFRLDLDGRFISVNPALQAMFGENMSAGNHDAWERHFESGSWQRLQEMVMARGEGEMEVRAQDGERVFLAKVALENGKIEGFLQDITEKLKANEELLYMADNDPLTKVANRRGVEKLLNAAMQGISEEQPLSLAYLDLDRFKLINDLYGHAAGDEVLKQVCGRILAMLSGDQRMGRVGGDEFIIYMPDTPIPSAAVVCREIVEHIGTLPYRVGDNAFQVRASIGLIDVKLHTKIKDAVSTADQACREAKAGTGNGLVVYDKNATEFREHEAELALVERIADGSVLNDLFLDMQPIMSLRHPHATLDFEVLLRVRDLEGGLVSAGRIIGAAENSGRIGVIDRWVLATALTWITEHAAELPRTGFVCMNLSGASLNDERFVQDAFTMLKNNPPAAQMLCLEITESVALHDMEHTRRFINQVRSFGVRVALDDFGAGYTSFSYLKDLPADILKIDGSFIVNMNAHPVNSAIVGAIVKLAKTLNMKTIAEWAEDGATVRALAELGVDYVQGYAVARPQAPAAILAATSCASFIRDADVLDFVGADTAPQQIVLATETLPQRNVY